MKKKNYMIFLLIKMKIENYIGTVQNVKKMFSNRFKNSYLKSYAEKSFYEQHFVCNEESHKPFWKKMYI